MASVNHRVRVAGRLPRACDAGRVDTFVPEEQDRVAASYQAALFADLDRAPGIYAQRLLDGDAPWMMMRSVRGGQRVQLRLVVLGAGADPGVADPDAVIEDGRGAHELIVSVPVPEPAQRHAVAGLVCGTVSAGRPEHAAVVPETTDSGTTRSSYGVT